jgi:hypothetical protein
MDLSHAFDLRRWRRRFKSDDAVAAEARASGRAPDATIEEVGSAGDATGFDGKPIRSAAGNGQGSDQPAGPGWAGWGA